MLYTVCTTADDIWKSMRVLRRMSELFEFVKLQNLYCSKIPGTDDYFIGIYDGLELSKEDSFIFNTLIQETNGNNLANNKVLLTELWDKRTKCYNSFQEYLLEISNRFAKESNQ
jgi:hypothetical protein